MDIASFKTTPSYAQASERLRMFFLRGQDVDPEYLREAGILSKIYQVQSEVHVINILGYVLNKPFANFELPAEQLERMLRLGNVCMYAEEARKQLEKVVKQMKSYRFELIPLVVAMEHKKQQKLFETVLIKVHCKSGGCAYVDISGRTYTSFGNFLSENKLPPGVLCYPENGIVVFDDQHELLVECCEVGVANTVKGGLDVIVGLVGAAGTVGSIFATGGLAIPFVVVSCGSALYATGRGVEKLVDASQHGMSLNPFEDAEARNNWLMVSANLLTFASLGAAAGLAAATKMESVTATQLGRIMLANRIIRGVSAGVNAVTVLDSVAFTVNNWKRMTIYEKISLACAVCFCFREVINFANAERLIRASQVDGMCKFFRGCSDSVVGGVSTVGQSFVTNVKKVFEGNDEYVEAGMRLIRTIVQDSFDVTVSDDFVHIRLFGFEYKVRNVISMPESELNKFLYMIQGIAKTFKDAFALMRTVWGDGPIATVVFKRAEDLGGNRADFGTAINQLIEVFMLVRRICDDFSILSDAQLRIGAGHRFTVGSAFDTFVRRDGVGNGISLLRALLEMNPRETNRLNNFRQQWGSQEAVIFSYATNKANDSAEMLSRIRFLLDVSEICTEKSVRMTELQPEDQMIEIESMIRIIPDMFRQAANSDFLIDPKFLQICRRALGNHREFLETIWRNTCFRPGPEDKAFEKLTALEVAFQSRSDATIENVVSYVSTMHCEDFSRFVTHSLFALDGMHSLIRETNLSEPEANSILFSDPAPLRSRFLELTAKVQEHSLGGYHPIDERLLDVVDPECLVELVKGLASEELLRFGTAENGALHLNKYPMLRFGSEMQKFNRLIARKKFEREEVQPAYAGKRMVFLGNEQLRIVVGLVRGVGAYIDTFMFTHVD